MLLSTASAAAAAANVVLESVSRVMLGNAVGALSSFQLKCAMLRSHWWAAYSGTAGNQEEEEPGRRVAQLAEPVYQAAPRDMDGLCAHIEPVLP